jgi:hypothetical protein
MAKGAITRASASSWIGGIQKSLLLFGRKEMNDPPIRPHHGACQHTANLVEGGGKPVFHEVHERFDGRQAKVPGPWAVGALGLEVFQKGHHQRGIEMFEMEIGRRDTEPSAGE